MRMGIGWRVATVLAPGAVVLLWAVAAAAQGSGGAAATKPGAIEHQMTKPDFKRGSAMELPRRSGTAAAKKSPPVANGKTGPGADVGQKK